MENNNGNNVNVKRMIVVSWISYIVPRQVSTRSLQSKMKLFWKLFYTYNFNNKKITNARIFLIYFETSFLGERSC